jgi:hypothetical protein
MGIKVTILTTPSCHYKTDKSVFQSKWLNLWLIFAPTKQWEGGGTRWKQMSIFLHSLLLIVGCVYICMFVFVILRVLLLTGYFKYTSSGSLFVSGTVVSIPSVI